MTSPNIITEFGDIPSASRIKILTHQAKLRLKQIEHAAWEYKHSPVMFAGYDSVRQSPKKLPKQMNRIEKALGRFGFKDTDGAFRWTPDEQLGWKDKARRDFLRFQEQLLQRRVKEATAEVERRLAYVKKIVTPKQIEDELQKCREDIFHWFDHYAITLDPRNPVMFLSPFTLFPKQREYVSALDEAIFVTQEWLIAEKSRDEGISWTTMAYMVYRFLFPESDASHFLIASMKAPDVDTLGNPSSLIEKARIQIKFLPEWMLPKGWNAKANMTHFRLTNPENGSSITGSTANTDVGRGGRFTAIFFDEAASIEKDEAAFTAASQSSNCLVLVSTPKGKQNQFYLLRHSGDYRVITFHWTQNPFKSQAWYDYQKLKLSPTMLAQEVDIDYEMSQSGRIFPEWSEPHHVITWSEFSDQIAGSWEQGMSHPHVPRFWSRMRTHDWGSTGDENSDHACVVTWFATAPEGTVTKSGHDISGCVFVYRVYIPEAHTTVNAVARHIKQVEKPLQEQERMFREMMSHEQSAVLDVYNQEHGMSWSKWKVGAHNRDFGIARVREYLELETRPHPFRDVLDKAPRLFFIVADNEGALFFDENSRTYKVRPALSQAGLKRARLEMSTYHWSEDGKTPEKFFDDFADTLRGGGIEFPPKLAKNKDQMFEESLPESLQAKTIIELPQEMQGIAYLSRLEHISTIPKQAHSRFAQMMQNARRGF